MLRKTFLIAIITLFAAAAVLAQAPEDKSATVFGAKIRYLEAGSPGNPTVVLLHGLGGQAENWQFTIPALAAKYRVLAPDQIGFGKSDKPLLKYRVGTYVDFLDKFLSQLNIEKATLVGNSLGGWIAGLYTVRYPSRVEKLVLVDAAGLTPEVLDPKPILRLNASTREEVRDSLKAAFYNKALAENPAVVDQFLTIRVTNGDGYTISSLTESILRGEDFLDTLLGEIKKPTLIVWGKQDGLLPYSDAERFQKGIAGSELFAIDECGHVPMFEKPVEFNAKVLEFIAK